MMPGNLDDDEDDESRADASGEIRLPATLESSGPVPATRRDRDRRRRRDGPGDRVLPRAARPRPMSSCSSAATSPRARRGRNGGGVRQQWSTEINIRLMQESVELCRRFAVDLGVNVWFRQGGYLFLARTQKEVARLEKNIALQNRCGVAHEDARSPKAAQEIVPELDLAGIVGAAVQPDRRHPVPVAVPVGLRAPGRRARRADLHADAGRAASRRSTAAATRSSRRAASCTRAA